MSPPAPDEDGVAECVELLHSDVSQAGRVAAGASVGAKGCEGACSAAGPCARRAAMRRAWPGGRNGSGGEFADGWEGYAPRGRRPTRLTAAARWRRHGCTREQRERRSGEGLCGGAARCHGRGARPAKLTCAGATGAIGTAAALKPRLGGARRQQRARAHGVRALAARWSTRPSQRRGVSRRRGTCLRRCWRARAAGRRGGPSASRI